ncbi:hypothetical protein [Mycobacteroides abscessus]|nr:hypothetical protein [Mycobacteroides abscessus]
MNLLDRFMPPEQSKASAPHFSELGGGLWCSLTGWLDLFEVLQQGSI